MDKWWWDEGWWERGTLPAPANHAVRARAAAYRSGRAFLAGDAAHLNNPLGGMGMNGGIHDAFALARALVAIARGEADERALDRVERQRRWVALEFVQANAKRNRDALNQADPALRARHHDDLRRMAEDPVRAKAYLRSTSMIEALERAVAGGAALIVSLGDRVTPEAYEARLWRADGSRHRGSSALSRALAPGPVTGLCLAISLTRSYVPYSNADPKPARAVCGLPVAVGMDATPR